MQVPGEGGTTRRCACWIPGPDSAFVVDRAGVGGEVVPGEGTGLHIQPRSTTIDKRRVTFTLPDEDVRTGVFVVRSRSGPDEGD